MRLLSLCFCDFSTLSLFSVNFFPNIQHSRCFRLLKSLPRDVLFSFARHSRTIRLVILGSLFHRRAGRFLKFVCVSGIFNFEPIVLLWVFDNRVLIRTTLLQFLFVDIYTCHHSRGFCVPILPIIQHSRAFSHAIL